MCSFIVCNLARFILLRFRLRRKALFSVSGVSLGEVCSSAERSGSPIVALLSPNRVRQDLMGPRRTSTPCLTLHLYQMVTCLRSRRPRLGDCHQSDRSGLALVRRPRLHCRPPIRLLISRSCHPTSSSAHHGSLPADTACHSLSGFTSPSSASSCDRLDSPPSDWDSTGRLSLPVHVLLGL